MSDYRYNVFEQSTYFTRSSTPSFGVIIEKNILGNWKETHFEDGFTSYEDADAYAKTEIPKIKERQDKILAEARKAALTSTDDGFMARQSPEWHRLNKIVKDLRNAAQHADDRKAYLYDLKEAQRLASKLKELEK